MLQGLNEGDLLGEQGGIVARFLGEQGVPGMELYALLAGSGYKEAGDHDMAANLFFMCINEGMRMPGSSLKWFSSSSRNLNMLEASRAAREGRSMSMTTK